MNFGNIVIMMSKFGSKSGDFAQRGEKSDNRCNKKKNFKNITIMMNNNLLKVGRLRAAGKNP